MSGPDLLKEVADRTRRIETRLTKYMEKQGFETGVQRPQFDEGDVLIPSKSVSLLDILNCIPPEWREREIRVWLGRDLVCRFWVD